MKIFLREKIYIQKITNHKHSYINNKNSINCIGNLVIQIDKVSSFKDKPHRFSIWKREHIKRGQ
ncbi:hypothetical protein DERF_011853 [Dermatophagoides farinae]|uniref:Uncharacterized protein n=1 Tax=Dermatophagoides farinae TaxID=6954 RepID=A0A922HW85_DERFA|nr:hypothetical protein DERF_011853 [Dermatophagoides farinae]